MVSAEREASRNQFFTCWQKHKNKSPLEPLEAQILETILLHPEYHPILDKTEDALAKDYTEHNPFLHMGLHLALRDQLSTDLPKGIRQIYKTLCNKNHDTHAVEHQMMNCLIEHIWEMQHLGKAFDTEGYIASLHLL